MNFCLHLFARLTYTMIQTHSKVPKLAVLLLTLILIYCIAHFLITLAWMGSPYPNEYREWANIEAACEIYSGRLYGMHDDDGIYLYGFLYPWLCRWITDGIGGSLLINARAVCYACTLLSAGLGAYMIRRRGGSAVASALGFALLLTTNWYNVTGVAQPATLGVLLLMLSLYFADVKRNGWLWCAVMTVLCFYTKAYFVAVFFPLFIKWFIQSHRTAWLYTGACLTLGLLSVFIVQAIYPAFFAFHVLHHLNASTGSLRHLIMQLGPLTLFFFPLWLMAALRIRSKGGFRDLDVFGWSAVLFFIIWLRLGMHVGAAFTYAYHLWLPPLCIYALSGVRYNGNRYQRIGLWLCTLFGLYVAGYQLNLPRYAPVRDFNRENFHSDILLMTPSESIACFSPAMAVYANQYAIPLYNNGQSQYVPTLQTNNHLLKALLPDMEKVEHRSNNFEKRMVSLIKGRTKRMIVTDNFSFLPDSLLLSAGYSRQASTLLQTGRHKLEITFWGMTPQ